MRFGIEPLLAERAAEATLSGASLKAYRDAGYEA
jgi:hypothetical protein